MYKKQSYEAVIHRFVDVPEDARVFIVGDIHGEYKMLQDLLATSGFIEGRDHLVCVGDLIDRGPNNLQVMSKFLFDNPRHHCVMGNHDMFMATSKIRKDSYSMWLYNGGKWIIDEGYSEDDLEYFGKKALAKLPIFITIRHGDKRYGVCHAGLPLKYEDTGDSWATPNWDDVIDSVVERTDVFTRVSGYRAREYWSVIDPYLWDRDVVMAPNDVVESIPSVEAVDLTFHGHTPVKEAVKIGNRCYIDTGGTFNKRLTVAIPNRKTGQVQLVTSDEYNPEGIWKII